MKYVFKYIYFIFALVLLARSAFAHPSCDDQLEPQKPPIESVATISADAKSYLSLVNLYLDKNPDTVLKVSDLIAKSESFINPIEDTDGSFALQVSNGIERLRKRIDSQAWKQIQAGMLVTKKEKIEVQESKEVAREETSHLFGATVIDELKINGAGEKIFHFQQKERSYLLTTGRNKNFFLFEVASDKVKFVKEIPRLFHDYDFDIVTDEDRTYLFQRGWRNDPNGKPIEYVLDVSEFAGEDFNHMVKMSSDVSFGPESIHIKDEDIYFFTRSMFGEVKAFQIKETLFGNDYQLVSLKNFKASNTTLFASTLFEEEGSTYLAYDYKEADKRIWRPKKWAPRPERKRKFIIQKLNSGFFEFSVKKFNYVLTSAPVNFERDGHRYLAFGALKEEKSIFQVYRFDRDQLVLVDEVPVEEEVKHIYLASNGSFILVSTNFLNLAELKEKSLSVTAVVHTEDYINFVPTLLKSSNREFILVRGKNHSTGVFWSGTYEIDNGAFVMAADLKVTNYAEVPSTQHPDEVLLAVSRDEKIQLIRLVKTVKVKK